MTWASHGDASRYPGPFVIHSKHKCFIASNRRVFVHINNTNPVLVDNSRERQAAEAAGWEISYDGMEIAL